MEISQEFCHVEMYVRIWFDMLIDFVFCLLLRFELPFESCLSVISYLWVHLYTSNGLSYELAFSFIGVVTSILSIEWKFGGAHFGSW